MSCEGAAAAGRCAVGKHLRTAVGYFDLQRHGSRSLRCVLFPAKEKQWRFAAWCASSHALLRAWQGWQLGSKRLGLCFTNALLQEFCARGNKCEHSGWARGRGPGA